MLLLYVCLLLLISGVVGYLMWVKKYYECIVDVPFTMRDGVVLYGDVYKPLDIGEKTVPVLLIRTPYSKAFSYHLMEVKYFVEHGYIVVVQDTRGRYTSKTEWIPVYWEGQDGYDTVEICARIENCDGRVATLGQSYLGMTQVLLAAQKPPSLYGCCITSPCGPLFRNNFVFRQGILEKNWTIRYFLAMAQDILRKRNESPTTVYQYFQVPKWWKILYHCLKIFNLEINMELAIMLFPLKQDILLMDVDEIIELMESLGIFFMDDFLQGGDQFWDEFQDLGNSTIIEVPVFLTTSWNDKFLLNAYSVFTNLRHSKILIGPWGHLMRYLKPTSTGGGIIKYDAQVNLLEEHLEWLQILFSDKLEENDVRYFRTGANEWVVSNQWPVGAFYQLYFETEASLTFKQHLSEFIFDLAHDPENPIPTKGGCIIDFEGKMGFQDFSGIQESDTVKYLKTDLLEDEVVAEGSVIVQVAVTCEENVKGKIHAVLTDDNLGRVINIADGIAELNGPGIVEINLWSIAHLFKAGHRIGLQLTCSSVPRYENDKYPFEIQIYTKNSFIKIGETPFVV